MQIQKVKLIKGGESIKIVFTKQESDRTATDVEETHRAPIHADFKAAIKSLAIHFAILADYVQPKNIKSIDKYDVELITPFHVSGYSIGGDEDDRGVVITGHKTKSNGKAIIINTPFTRFVEAEESQYQFIDHLEQRINEVEKEVELYLDGKRAPEAQQSLFPDGDFEQAPSSNNTGDDLEDENDHDDEVTTVKDDLDVKSKKKRAPKKLVPKKASSKKVA